MGRHKKDCQCDKCMGRTQPATESAAKAEFCRKETEQEEAELAAANEAQPKTE